MNRKADAAGSKSTSSHPVARRLSRFKSRFPRLLRTDYWITSRRSLWATLFAREKSATSRRTRLVRRAHKTTVEGLEDRRLLANFSIAGGNLNLDLSDLNSSVALVAGATNYTLTLTGGTWSGTNSGSVTGNGTNTLTVTKDAFPLINVTDSNSGISVTFNDSGANTYTDDWSIVLAAAAASSISFNGATPFATTSNLSASTTKNILFNSGASVSTVAGTIRLTSVSGAITSGTAASDIIAGAGTVSLSAGSGGIGASGNPLVVSGTNLETATSGNGNQFLAATGTISIDSTGLSAGTGTVELDGGTFNLGGSNRINDSTKLAVSGATFGISTFNETVDTLTLITGSVTGTSGVLTSTNTIQAQGGSASANLGGANGLTKSTAATTILSGGNTYTGATTINGGLLQIDGSLAAGSTVAVNSGGTLGGSGTINGAVNVNNNGKLNPGDSPGKLTVNNNVAFASGSLYVPELNGPNTAGTDYDQLVVNNGNVTIASGAILLPAVNYAPAPPPTAHVLTVINHTGTGAVSGTFNYTIASGLHAVYNANQVNLVENSPTTVTVNSPSVTVNEGSQATNGGTYSDTNGDPIAITASVGTISQTGTTNGTWSWSFNTIDGPNQSQTVTITFTDTLTNGTTTQSFPLTVLNVPPTIAVGGNAHTPEGSLYFLTLGAITDPGQDTVTQWTVHWGDGQTSVYPNGGLQSHVYFDGPAVAPITVDLVDEDGTFLNRGNPFTVIVDNVPPSIVLTGNAIVNEGGSYSLTLGAISDPGPDFVTAYTVRWGDGATTGPIVGNPTGQVLTHTYADGTTTPTIAVDLTDEDGLELNAGTKTITVNNVQPTIAISGAATVAEGAPYSLTLGAITDPGPDTVTQWIVHWGDGQTSTFTSGGVQTHAYADGPAGPFNITVDLTDEDGTFLNRANALAVSVTNVASTIALTGNATANEGIPYSLTLGTTDPGTDTVTSYTIHWGDGTNTGPVSGNPNGQVVAHTYADGPVSRTITVDVTDEDGTFLVAGTKTITVNNVAPTIALAGNATVNEGALYSLTLGAVTDPGTDTVTSYTIHWGDGANTGPVTGNPTGQVVTHTYVNGPTSPTITVDLVDEDGTALAAGTKTITVANVAATVSALSGPTTANFGATKHYTFSITDPGTLDTFSVATSSGGTQATLSNLSIDNVTRTGGFDATFSGGSGSTTLSLQVKDQDGNLSNVSTLTVSLVNVFQVIGFQTTPSGFDATFNRAPVLSDVNLYDGVDVIDDLPDVVLHAGGANTDVRGSLVWNGTTNTMSFVKTGGLLAPGTYSVTLRSSLNGFHDASGHLLDGNGDLNDTQVNDNYVNSFTLTASTARVVSIKDFARGPGQPVNQDPLVANSRLAVSIDNATGVRSVTFTLTYDPGLLHVSTATLAAGLPADWTISINSNVPGSLTLTASGATQLAGSNLPLVLITADVPATAPYGALEALRLAGLTVNIQSGTSTVATPSLADIAVHKNVYLGDADGNGIYTGTDAGLISRVTAGIDTGFDAHSWTDPLIVADIDGTNTLTGGDASLVAQKSVLLPTPQIPSLPVPPLVLVPNGGGSLALDDVPQTASTSVVSSPSRMAAAVVEVPSVTATTTTVVSTFTAPAQSNDAAAASPSRQAVGDRSIVVLPLALESNVGLASGRWSGDSSNSEAIATPSLSKTSAESPRDVDHYFSQLPHEMASAAPLQTESAVAANNHEDDAADHYFESLSEDERLVAAL